MAAARILEGPVLQPILCQATYPAVAEELLPVTGHEMSHFTAVPLVAVQPEPSVQSINEPLAPTPKLTWR